jgi:hypothetical protein
MLGDLSPVTTRWASFSGFVQLDLIGSSRFLLDIPEL